MISTIIITQMPFLVLAVICAMCEKRHVETVRELREDLAYTSRLATGQAIRIGELEKTIRLLKQDKDRLEVEAGRLACAQRGDE